MPKVYDGDLNSFMDFAAAGPQGEPASGLAVQRYIKSKFGAGYTVGNGTEHLLFADEAARDAYIEDPTREDLILDRISLESLYRMEITLLSSPFVPILTGQVGNYIEFTFQTLTKNDQVIAESVIVNYTINKGGASRVVTEIYRPGTTVRFKVDDYLTTGRNDISIHVVGQDTQVGATRSVTYQVVDLALEDRGMDIAHVYEVGGEPVSVEIPYHLAGVGQKTVEWYLDEVLVDADEVLESDIVTTKTISIDLLSEGSHSLQFRAGLIVSGETFYTKTLYRKFFVKRDSSTTDVHFSVAIDLPVDAGIVEPGDDVTLYATQYEAINLPIAAWKLSSAYNTVNLLVGGTQLASVVCERGVAQTVILNFATAGIKTLTLVSGESTREISVVVAATSMHIHEINENLALAFSSEGRTNSSSNRSTWTDGTHTATFTGFKWVDTSGWVDGKLLIDSGSSLSFNYAPLAVDPQNRGKTIEVEFKSVNVEDENAVLCNITLNNIGVKITATEILIRSYAGVELSRKYKANENIRMTIVFNKRTGVDNKGLVFIYFNGILSVGGHFAQADNFIANANLTFGGVGAGMLLKQVRIYDIALSHIDTSQDFGGVLNNYILYRDSVEEMLSVYDKNSLYEEGTTNFDINKIAAYLPVMLITGDIPKIEGSTSKKTEIVADVQYINLQKPSYSFTVKDAIVTGQGTSSMFFPKKNLRLYSAKSDQTKFYDYQGNLVEGGEYSFKENAQPVTCWCLKTDYAESSGTHNTGIARLWNDVLKKAKVENDYVLRTEAQQTALDNNYGYDVRTTVDGFPIVIFYRLTDADPWIFLGKYNFNNDKSTESVFGFCDIPGFDDEHVQCFEFLDSANQLALFTTIEGFDENWDKAWESRYPDTKTPVLGPLKTLATWINSTMGADPTAEEGTPAKLAYDKWRSEKGDHFDLNKLAAYYVYLMRFGAVDQTVKNAMLMTEDGVHWFFINYDNDTINGVRNDGFLKYGPDIDRQSWDSEYNAYCYAGHDSVLWNNFEADSECMALAKEIDGALYTAGLSYEGVIEMFNTLQAGKWAETIYNKDAQYKYVDQYVKKNDDQYLPLMQGSRADHRKWWLSTRFAYYDAVFVNGGYQAKRITFRATAEAGAEMKIVAGKDFYYGYGLNAYPLESGVHLAKNGEYTFVLSQDINLGSPVGIYAPYYIKTLDLSDFIDKIGSVLDIGDVYNEELGSNLKNLILGVDVDNDVRRNNSLAGITGLSSAVNLEVLDIRGYTALTSIDLSNQKNLTTFLAKGSGITSVTFGSGAPLTMAVFPLTLLSLTLSNLPSLTAAGITLVGNGVNIDTISIHNCPLVSNSIGFILGWINSKASVSNCSLTMDNIEWNNADPDDLITIGEVGTRLLSGVCRLDDCTDEQFDTLVELFPGSFESGAAFRIIGPDKVAISGPTSVLEGDSATYRATVSSEYPGTLVFSIQSGSRPGTSIDPTTGVLTTTENGEDTANITIRATHTPTQGQVTYKDIVVTIEKAIYPTIAQVSIGGNAELTAGEPSEYELAYSIQGVNGRMTGVWTLTGDLASYATITSQNNSGCVISMPTEPSGNTTGTLSCALTKTSLGTSIGTVTKEIKFELKTRVTVNEVTNQSSHSDVANVEATVSYAAGGPLANGVYILYTDGSLSDYSALTPGKVPVGPVLKTDNVSLVIYPTKGNSKIWSSNKSTIIPGVTTTTDKNVAKQDYAGKANTAAVIASGLAGTAFTWIQSLGNEWYLPACGEMEEIRLNVTNIDTALTLIGGDKMSGGVFNWTSTQYNASWAVSFDAYYGYNYADKDYTGYKTRAVKTYSTLTVVQVPNGGHVDVPRGSTVTIDYPAVSGYATPAQQILVTGGAAMTVTGTYNTEVVTVNVTTDTQGVSAEGQIITINGNTYTVGASGIVTAKVPYGANYTISANAKQGYNIPADQSFTAGQVSRSVTMEYTEKMLGVFIVYTDGTLSNYDTLDSGKTPDAVVLITDNVSIKIKNKLWQTVWSSDTSTKISGVTTTTDVDVAKQDFAGEANTAAVIASGIAGTAFTKAKNLGEDYYLPASGEMWEIYINLTNINTALSLIGDHPVQTSDLWTSTQISNSNAWCFYAAASPFYANRQKSASTGSWNIAVAKF